jgi:hypothetical protein
MAANHLKPGPDIFPARLDRFGMNKIFFYDLFCIKQSRLVLGLFCLAFKWSGFQMVETGIRSNLKAEPCPGFGWVLYSNHPKVGLSGFPEFDSCPDAEWSGFQMPFENLNKNDLKVALRFYTNHHCPER